LLPALVRAEIEDLAMRRFILIAVGLLLAPPVRAAPPPDADGTLAPWFQSLRQPNTGVSCCSMADCRTVDYRTDGDSYEALIEGRWIIVPREKILQRIDNPTGRAVVCWTPALGVLCFVRASEI
jgi:hypothetical protein